MKPIKLYDHAGVELRPGDVCVILPVEGDSPSHLAIPWAVYLVTGNSLPHTSFCFGECAVYYVTYSGENEIAYQQIRATSLLKIGVI